MAAMSPRRVKSYPAISRSFESIDRVKLYFVTISTNRKTSEEAWTGCFVQMQRIRSPVVSKDPLRNVPDISVSVSVEGKV